MALKLLPMLDVLRKYKKLAPEELESQLGPGFLLVHGHDPSSQGPGNFKTLGIDKGQLQIGSELGKAVVYVMPRETQESFMIKVGRTDNNDVVLAQAGVSKFHAWFRRDAATGKYLVQDAESENGTTVEGQELSAPQSKSLNGGERIVFGKIAHAEFHTPQTMAMCIASLRRFVRNDRVKSFLDES